MDKQSKEFLKFLSCAVGILMVAILSMNLGFKAIDRYFPSKFDKLVHCNKAD